MNDLEELLAGIEVPPDGLLAIESLRRAHDDHSPNLRLNFLTDPAKPDDDAPELEETIKAIKYVFATMEWSIDFVPTSVTTFRVEPGRLMEAHLSWCHIGSRAERARTAVACLVAELILASDQATLVPWTRGDVAACLADETGRAGVTADLKSEMRARILNVASRRGFIGLCIWRDALKVARLAKVDIAEMEADDKPCYATDRSALYRKQRL